MVLLDVDWAALLDVTLKGENEEKNTVPVLARAASMAEGGIEQSGYIDIKQPPKVKGRKLKSWKKKWVVLHEMSIRAAGRAAAKVDVYSDEKTASKCPSDKHTFILEYVTEIRAAKSKTREHAFEIVENEAVLLLSGHTELESQTWISALRKIFWPHQIENHCYNVSIVQNEHSRRLSLEGAYVMTITPEVIGIESDIQNSYEWSLPMLKRFYMDNDQEYAGKEVLVIECGPKSECGQATFSFRSEDVKHILASIKKNIFTAINIKKCANSSIPPKAQTNKHWRTSVTSGTSGLEERRRSETVSSSEQNYRELLDPIMPDSKRTRLMSTGSDLTNSSNDKTSMASGNDQPRIQSTDDMLDIPARKRTSVTFETPKDITKKETIDLLSDSIEMADKEEASEYNTASFNPVQHSKAPNIITTFTIANKPGHQTKVLMDDRGYSHVSFKDKVPVIDDNKTRSLSNISSHSSVSCRSASVGSRDSGIQYQTTENTDQFQRGTTSNRSTNSFDSAVSTSSTADTKDGSTIVSKTAGILKVEIQEVEISETGEIVNALNDDGGIYQDVSLEEENATSEDKNKTVPKLLKSNSVGDCRIEENEYEDLEKYQKGKKDIWKHLGIDRSIDPNSIPPALPERPTSHKMKRKFHNQDKKLFTLPFVKNRLKKSKEIASSTSSSSDSDNESVKDSKTNADMSLKKWPLGNKSVIVGNNDLYQPVAIERFLNDEDDNMVHKMRERSSSLNLNMSTSLKRPSVILDREENTIERKTAMWKHNRNVSMNVDIVQRMTDSKTMDSNMKQRFEMALRHESVGESIFESTADSNSCDLDAMRSRSNTDISFDDLEEEPIYAEVGPVSKLSHGEAENPFPDIDPWKAHDDQASFLNHTQYENDDSVNIEQTGDLLNQGFVTFAENSDKVAESVIASQAVTDQRENLLIDFTDTCNDNSTDKSAFKNTTAVDIFNMGFDPLFSISDPCSGSTITTVTNTPTSLDFIDIFHLGIYTPEPNSQVNTLNKNMADFSCLENIPSESTDATLGDEPAKVEGRASEINDTIYMDMTACKNESIYVMPSTLKK